jgi:hypothetical protein
MSSNFKYEYIYIEKKKVHLKSSKHMELFDIYYYSIDPDTGIAHSRKLLKTVGASDLIKEVKKAEFDLHEQDPNFEVDYEPHHSRQEKIDEMRHLLSRVYEIADELGYDNIFYNEGFAELLLAEKLGHTWNHKTQGPDAWLPNMQTAEYKTAKPGGSFQFHWLSEKKMEKIQEIDWVYFAVREQLTFSNIKRIPMSSLLPLLEKSSALQGGSTHRSFSQTEIVQLGAEPAPEIYS